MYYGPGGMGEADGGLSKMDELDYELWHACAGPLTSLPPVDSLVMYWPQGHIEQVTHVWWFSLTGIFLSFFLCYNLSFCQLPHRSADELESVCGR